MTNRIKMAFDGIRAEESLKENTLLFLQAEMKKKRKPDFSLSVRRIAVALASLIIVTIGLFSSYNLYFTEHAYVDLDVNPSIEFTVNRFDRIIGAYAYNSDGKDILTEINVIHKDYRSAIENAIEAMEQKGFITGEPLISITLQTGDETKDAEMLTNIELTVQQHHGTAQINAFLVNSEIRITAHDLDLSPAKYLAIVELQKVDPTATVENCRGHSIGEIYRLTEGHSNGHHGGSAPSETEDNDVNTGHEGNGSHNGNNQSEMPQVHQNGNANRNSGGKENPSSTPHSHHGKSGRHN